MFAVIKNAFNYVVNNFTESFTYCAIISFISGWATGVVIFGLAVTLVAFAYSIPVLLGWLVLVVILGFGFEVLLAYRFPESYMPA